MNSIAFVVAFSNLFGTGPRFEINEHDYSFVKNGYYMVSEAAKPECTKILAGEQAFTLCKQSEIGDTDVELIELHAVIEIVKDGKTKRYLITYE